MIHRLAEYVVLPGEEAAAASAVATFVAAIGRAEPNTRYEAFQAQGDRRFVHLMTFENAAAEEAHRGAPHTQAFVAALYPVCEERPHFTALTGIG